MSSWPETLNFREYRQVTRLRAKISSSQAHLCFLRPIPHFRAFTLQARHSLSLEKNLLILVSGNTQALKQCLSMRVTIFTEQVMRGDEWRPWVLGTETINRNSCLFPFSFGPPYVSTPAMRPALLYDPLDGCSYFHHRPLTHLPWAMAFSPFV